MSINKIIKSTILNVDSSRRITSPKYIYKSDGKVLPNDPLYFTKDSNNIKIYYPNHQLSVGDNIIIQNVQGSTKILSNAFYLFNNFNYLIINYQNNNIPSNYNKYINSILIDVTLYGDNNISNMINNIPVNSFIGINQIYLYSDISTSIPTNINNYLKKFNTNDLLFIKLDFSYLSTSIQQVDIINQLDDISEQIVLNQAFKISFLNIAGINTGYINSNYPINNYNFQSNQTVYQVEENYIYISLNTLFGAYINTFGGGSRIQIMKILDFIEGFPYANNYEIELKQTFNNVINVELLSTEFPYIDFSIKNNYNNKFYWQNIEDGNTIYNISIDEGFYNLNTLIISMQTQINKVKRVTSTSTNPIYNIFNITYEKSTNKIIFKSYNNILLPASLSVYTVTIDNVDYYSLQIKHFSNNVSVGDDIVIQNAQQVSIITSSTNEYISPSYINNYNYTVYTVDNINGNYTILLGKVSNINTSTNTSTLTKYLYGGNDIIITQSIKIRLLFNITNTFGDILGFKDVGSPYSITPFNKIITNFDNYINDNNLNSVGDLVNTNNLINLSGQNTYLLMYLNNIEFINNTNLPTAFAKILLSGNQGDYLFNTFVKFSNDVYSPIFPISEINKLSISFLLSNGKVPDFRNINHSFTIKIIEEIVQSSETQQNSNHTNYINELRKLKI